jgi:hypothetical protein
MSEATAEAAGALGVSSRIFPLSSRRTAPTATPSGVWLGSRSVSEKFSLGSRGMAATSVRA